MTRAALGAVAYLIAFLGIAPVAAAQIVTSASFGVARVGRAELPEATMFAIGTDVDARWSRTSATAALGGERGPSGLEAARASGSVAMVSELFANSAFTATLSASTFGGSGHPTVTSIETSFNNVHQWWRHGFSYGGIGGARVNGGHMSPITSAVVEGWIERRGNDLTGTAALTLTTPNRPPPDGFGSVLFADAEASWQRVHGRTTLRGNAGVRFGFQQVERRTTWAEANITQVLEEGVSLVVGAGRRPTDISRGVPAERYASVTLKTAVRPRPRQPFRGR